MFPSEADSLFDGASIRRATSAPPVTEVGGFGLALEGAEDWSSYLRNNPHNLNPRLPFSMNEAAQQPQPRLDPETGPKLAQPQPRQRPHPGAIGTPVLPSPQPQDSPFNAFDEQRPRSVVDLIQQDFPRTPSPIYPVPSQPLRNSFHGDVGTVDNLQDAMDGLQLRRTSRSHTQPAAVTENHVPMYQEQYRMVPNNYTADSVGYHSSSVDGRVAFGEFVIVPVPGQPGLFVHQPASEQHQIPQRVVYVNGMGGQPYLAPAPGVRADFPPGAMYGHQSMPHVHAERGGRGRRRDSGRGRKGRESGSRSNGAVPSLLNELKHGNNKGQNWSLNHVKGHVVEFCKDQHGSRFIQQKLESATIPEKQFVFNEVLPQAQLLMTDVFGNYVVQKFYDFGLDEHRDLLTKVIVGRVVRLSMQMYGCRVIQKTLEVMPVASLTPLVEEFEGQVLDCVHDQNGNHVIQKCIERLARDNLFPQLDFIVESFRGRSLELASHPYGCRVIQRILEHCTPEQKNVILTELNGTVRLLVQDQYGNYVVQHMIQFGRDTDRAAVIFTIQENLFGFAMHKFASNVVEKCLQYGSQESKQVIIDEIINADGTSSCSLIAMVRDQYANYVIQKVIDLATQKQLSRIIAELRPNLGEVKKCTYGKHILARIEKATGEKFLNS